MAESIFETLKRLGVSLDQFCTLAAISRDDLDALNGGSALPAPRVAALLRLITNVGRAKVAPIVAMLGREEVRRWRTVAAFPAYEVSDDGMVRRCSASRRGSLRTLKPVLKNHGCI